MSYILSWSLWYCWSFQLKLHLNLLRSVSELKRVHKIPWYFNWTLIQHAQAWSKCEAITVVKKPCKKISLLIWALWLFKEIYFWTDTIRSKTLLRLYTWHTIIHAVQDMHSVCANLAVIINKDKCSYQ